MNHIKQQSNNELNVSYNDMLKDNVVSTPYVDWANAIHEINRVNNIHTNETILDTVRRLRFIHHQQLNSLTT